MPVHKIPVSEAQAGMITARDIKDSDGRVLIQSGSRLNPIAIRRFPLWDITELYIESDELSAERENVPEDTVTDESLAELKNNSNQTSTFTRKMRKRFRAMPNNDFYKEYVLLITKHILEDNEIEQFKD